MHHAYTAIQTIFIILQKLEKNIEISNAKSTAADSIHAASSLKMKNTWDASPEQLKIPVD